MGGKKKKARIQIQGNVKLFQSGPQGAVTGREDDVVVPSLWNFLMGHRAQASLSNTNGRMCTPSSHPQGKSRTALAWMHDFSCSVWACLHFVAPLNRGKDQRAFPLDPWPYTCNLDIVKYTMLGSLNHYLFWLFTCPFFQMMSKYKKECGSYFADVENCSQMTYTLASFFATPLPRSGLKCKNLHHSSPCWQRGSWPMVCSAVCGPQAITTWLAALGQVWWAARAAGWLELSAMGSCEPVATVDVDISGFPWGLSAGPAPSCHSHNHRLLLHLWKGCDKSFLSRKNSIAQ